MINTNTSTELGQNEVMQQTINTGVFFTIVDKKDGLLHIKIAISNNIKYDENNSIMTDTFLVDKVNEFYKFLENHSFIQSKKKQNELYIMTDKEYKQLIKIAKAQHIYYLNKDATTSDYVVKKININRGNKIQKYSPSGQLIVTYNGIRDATRNESITDAILIATINNKSLYNEHRWVYLNRDLPDDTVQDIGETVIKTKYKNELVAMLDIDKKEIVNIFINQKEASIARKLKSSASINHSILHGNICSGHYFQYYNDCSEELKNKYIESGKELPIKKTKGITIKQYNYENGELINEYPSLLDVQIKYQVSNKSLKNAIKTGEVLKNFIWKY
jgi:hypothetical protein